MDSDDFFNAAPRPREEVVNGRYRLPDPETGQERGWTRATNVAAVVADPHGLTNWKLKQVIKGLSRRSDLVALVRTLDEDNDKDVWDVVRQALDSAAVEFTANLGTAIHNALGASDRGLHYPEEYERYVAAYRAELARHRLTPIPELVECTVVNKQMGAAGKVDNYYRECDGSIVVGDKKSTGHLDLASPEIAVQLATYASAEYLRTPDGYVDLRPQHVRRDYAVVVHVDRETGAPAIYKVDLERGQLAANRAIQDMAYRRAKGLLLPYVAPPMPDGAPFGYDPVASGELADEQAYRTSARAAAAEMHEALTQALVELADPGNEHSVNSTTVSLGEALAADPFGQVIAEDVAAANRAAHQTLATGTPPAHEPQVPEPLGVAELMKLPKAELQRLLRSLDPRATVAHQRKVLAEKIDRLQRGETQPGALAVKMTGDPAEISGPINGVDPTDPHSPAFHAAYLDKIRRATSVADLARLNREVVRIGGDQAWDDEMTEVARARTAELDAAVRADEATNGQIELDLLGRIAAAQTSQALGEIWEAETVGGSAPERWFAAADQAARERLAAIQAATPPVPTNPFL